MLRLDPPPSQAGDSTDIQRGTASPSSVSETAATAPAERTISAAVIVGVAQAVEALLLAVLGYGIYAIHVGGQNDAFYVPVIAGSVLLANVFLNAARTHRISAYRTIGGQVGRALATWTAVMVLLTVAAFFFKAADILSRGWLIGWFLSGGLFLLAFRLTLRALIGRWTRAGRLKRRTVIVGGGAEAEELIQAIRLSASNDINLLGLFDDRIDARSPDVVAGVRKLGAVADLVEYARQIRLDLVIVSMPLSAEKRVLDMLKPVWVLPVDVRLSAHLSQLRFTSKAYSYLGDIPVFDMADRPISDWNLVFKWVFDKTVALAALLLLSPVMIAAAIAIKLESKGPVLFRQKRHGFNNELVEIFKFRSMYTDLADPSASRLVTRGDPRVTRVGRLIRKTSIDELPQLFNVLMGQISIVGPRPHALHAKAENTLYYEAVEGYFARHRVKPGMTGWAQINGWRGETDTIDKIMERVRHDLYYIENWSLFLDFYIVLMTPISLFTRSENAF